MMAALFVSKATDASVNKHNFAVHPLDHGVGDLFCAVTRDILQACLDRASNSLYWPKVCVDHSSVSVVEVVCFWGRDFR